MARSATGKLRVEDRDLELLERLVDPPSGWHAVASLVERAGRPRSEIVDSLFALRSAGLVRREKPRRLDYVWAPTDLGYRLAGEREA